MSVKKVKIVHEETGQESEVVSTSVDAWRTVGWTPVEDEGSQEAAADAPVTPNVTEVEVTAPKAKNGGPAAPDTSKKE